VAATTGASVPLQYKTLTMARPDKGIEKELDVALGKPKYYIETSGKKEGERYSWFPSSGDSMTDNTFRSIPGGSLVLGRWLPIKTIQDIPLHQPIVVVFNDNGQQYCILKTVCKIKMDTADREAMLSLRSYNPAPRCDDFWLPFCCLKFIFIVERVRRPDDSEFVPEQEEVIRKNADK